MKNRISVCWSFLIIGMFSLILAACGDSTDSSTEDTDDASENDSVEGSKTMDPVTLSFADFFPATHEAHIQLVQGWADRVEEATDGLVKVEVYPGESLLDSDDIYEGVISGVADVGHSSIGYNLGRFPLMGSMYLGGFPYKNSESASYVARDMIEEFNPEELQDTEIMFVYALGPGDILSVNKVETLEDLEGMEIRASGNQIKTFELLGATPIDIDMPDIYESLSRGVVDGLSAPIEALEGWNLAEVTNYITKVPFVYNNVHYVTMNKEVWDSFPADIQKKIEAINEELFEEAAAPLIDRINEVAEEYLDENFDHETIELSEEEQERWLERLEPIREDYIKELDEQGIPGEEVINKLDELTEKYNEQF